MCNGFRHTDALLPALLPWIQFQNSQTSFFDFAEKREVETLGQKLAPTNFLIEGIFDDILKAFVRKVGAPEMNSGGPIRVCSPRANDVICHAAWDENSRINFHRISIECCCL